MVEVKEPRAGCWQVWVNGIEIYGVNDEAAAYRIAFSIDHPERWPSAEEAEAVTVH